MILICVIIGEGVFADDKKDKENANNHQEFDFVNNDTQENQKGKNQKHENENDEKYENIYEEILKIVKKYNASYDKFNTPVNFYSKKIISSKLKYNGSLPIPIPIPYKKL